MQQLGSVWAHHRNLAKQVLSGKTDTVIKTIERNVGLL
jgi:hypothetical protein